MRLRPTIVALAATQIAASLPAAAAPKVDVIVLQNGTRVIGEVRSILWLDKDAAPTV